VKAIAGAGVAIRAPVEERAESEEVVTVPAYENRE
jgi:hypothetical protein